jgi:hypothetical protein
VVKTTASLRNRLLRKSVKGPENLDSFRELPLLLEIAIYKSRTIGVLIHSSRVGQFGEFESLRG